MENILNPSSPFSTFSILFSTMATISSFSRRVYLASRYHHSALRLSPSRRLQATVTSVQPSYSQSPPPPSYAANTSHQAPKGKEFNASVSAGHTALRVPERRAEWGEMGEGMYNAIRNILLFLHLFLWCWAGRCWLMATRRPVINELLLRPFDDCNITFFALKRMSQLSQSLDSRS